MGLARFGIRDPEKTYSGSATLCISFFRDSKNVIVFKGTVRPDWICMRVISLESPLKGHQPLHVFNFSVLILNIL
jgi:hypothetical protein